MCSWTCLGTCTCSRSKKKKKLHSSQTNTSTVPKTPPGTREIHHICVKVAVNTHLFPRVHRSSLRLHVWKAKTICSQWNFVYIFFLHCFALLCIMQCPDRLAGDRQQMSIDGYAVAAQTQVHPVLAHLLPLGNKFLPESERVSALFFFFLLTYLLVYFFCTTPDVALLYSPRNREGEGEAEELCSSYAPSFFYAE